MIALRGALRDFRNRLAPGAVVLLYHRVDDVSFDPQLLAVTPRHFDEHLQVIRRLATPLPLQELRERVAARGSGRGLVAVTFDDGYVDNVTNAKPLLEMHGIPATVFVSSGYTTKTRPFWWDELEQRLLHPHHATIDISVDIRGKRYEWSIQPSPEVERTWNVTHAGDPSVAQAAYRTLSSALGHLTVEERELALDAVRAATPDARAIPQRPMTIDELRTLPGTVVSIGAHTVMHPRLSALNEEQQRGEIRGSKERLQQMLDIEIRSFAYPFGQQSDYNRRSVSIVRECGFDFACSNFRDTVRPSTSAFELPRINVRDCDGAAFEELLRRYVRA